MTTLRTARLTLRPPTTDDLEPLHEVFRHPDAMRYWSTLPHADLAETRDFLNGMMSIPLARGEEFVATMQGRVIGKVGFWSVPEIGFIFHPDVWGKGVAYEAVSAVISHGFQTRRMDRITADVDPRNTGSIRLLDRLGFTETGRAENTFRIGETWCHSIYFALERDTAGF